MPSPAARAAPDVVTDFANQIKVGRYEHRREIGRGGMGKILEAVDKPLRRSVALKVLVRPGDEESQNRFIREARITGELQHPSIVPVHELNVDEKGELFYTMKLVRGVTLLEILQNLARRQPEALRRYSLSSLLTIFQKVCDAIAFAHSQPQPVIHRDLKPENIMVGNYGEVLVMDWGTAKILNSNAAADVSRCNSEEAPQPTGIDEPTGELFVTQAGSVMGTPGYMAPEQARGHTGRADQRTDIYALGGILYALLTLEAPIRLTGAQAQEFESRLHDGEDVTHKFHRHVAPLLSDRSARQKLDYPVPDSLVHVVLKAMAFRPDDRFATVKKLQADVAAYQSGFATSAEEARPWKRFKLLVARHKVLFSAIASVLVVLLAATAVSLQQRKVALQSNADLQFALHRASFADHESARQHFRDGQWRQGLALMGRALAFWPENRAAADYLLSAILFSHGDADRLPLFGVYHGGPIVSEAEFGPDGTRFLTGSYDGTVQVWDVATGAPVYPKSLQHSGSVNCAHFSPDGRKIVTATYDGFAYIWDAQTGRVLRKLEHGKPELDKLRVVESAVFSRDGKRVLTASWDHTARVWNADTGEQIAQLIHPHRVASAVFSPDESRILCGYWAGGAMLWDAATFQPIARLAHGGTCRRLLFSPDGRYIATASLDHTARIWDAQTAQPICEPLKHGDQVWALAISPDGRRLATASHDNTARLWSMIDGSPVGAPMQHNGPVDTVAFSPNGTRLITASRDKAVRLWDVKTCRPIGERIRHDDAVFNAIFSSDGSKVLSVSWDHAAYLWSPQPRDWPGEKLPVPEKVRHVEFTKNPEHIFMAKSNGHAGIWSLTENRFITPEVDHGAELVTGAISRNDSVFATAGTDNVLYFWDTRTGTKLGETPKQDSPISAIVFSNDGSSLFTAYLSGLVLQCSVPDGKPLGKPITHPEYIDAIAVAPSAKEIATGCRDDFLRFWDPQTGTSPRRDIRHNNPVLSISYHPDGKLIATGGADYTARIWSLQTGEQLGPALVLNGPVTSVRYVAGGRALLAASTQDEEVSYYDPSTGTALFPGLPHAAGLVSASASNDGSEIVTVTADGTARLWRIPSASVPPPKWLGDYLRAIGGLSFSAEQQLTQVPTAERLRLRQTLLENVRDSSVWESVMRRSFQPDTGYSTESPSR